MSNSRLARFRTRIVLFLSAVLTAWLVIPAAAVVAAPAAGTDDALTGGSSLAATALTKDPFNGGIPGDVSDGNGALPPAHNAPGDGAIVQTAMPGVNVTQTRFGPIDDTDRLFLVKVRQAGLWERPTGLRAQTNAGNARFKEVGGILASDHLALDAEDRYVAQQLNVALPDQPSTDQQTWMRDFWDLNGHDFDVEAVRWLRFAHGVVFGAIATERAGTRNDLMRLFAERANDMVNKHMSLLESTGLVQYDNMPRAAIGLPAAALAGAAAPSPKDTNLMRPTVMGLVIVAAMLGLVSIRRVVRGA